MLESFMAPWAVALELIGAAARPKKCPLEQHRKCAWRKKPREVHMPTNSTRFIGNGRLTCDPATHQDGRMTRFGVAFDDDYKDANGNWVEQTIFIEVQTWNSTAEAVRAAALKKGDMISVVGKIKQSRNEKNELWTKVWAESVNLLARNGNKAAKKEAAPPTDDVPPMDPRDPGYTEGAGSDDVPF